MMGWELDTAQTSTDQESRIGGWRPMSPTGIPPRSIPAGASPKAKVHPLYNLLSQAGMGHHAMSL
jgi:hypothetical protein